MPAGLELQGGGRDEAIAQLKPLYPELLYQFTQSFIPNYNGLGP
jgi:hypothetical protein